MKRQNQAYFYALAVVCIWSTVASAFKITLRFIDFENLVFYSVAVSLLTLFAVVLVQKKLNLLTRHTTRDVAAHGTTTPDGTRCTGRTHDVTRDACGTCTGPDSIHVHRTPSRYASTTRYDTGQNSVPYMHILI